MNPAEDPKDKLEPIKIRITPEDLSRSSSPNVNLLPMSMRQQLALLKQKEQPSPSGSTDSERPSTPSRRRISKIHKKNDRGETPLHVLARKGATQQCLELIQQGAEVNCADYAGWTPLHEACSHRAFDTAKLLIEHGADVNKPAEDGETPLHDAVANKDIRIVWLLLRHQADRTVRTKDGRQPIDQATDSEIAALLMNETQPEECPRSRSISRQPSPVVDVLAEEQVPLEKPVLQNSIIEAIPPAAPLAVSIESQISYPPPQLQERLLPPEHPQIHTYVQPSNSLLDVAPLPFRSALVTDLELSEQSSASSSRAASPIRVVDTSPSASPEQTREESVSRDTAAFDFMDELAGDETRSREEKIESLKKKTGRGGRGGRGGRPSSGTATPVTSAKKPGRGGGRGGRRGRGAARVAETFEEDPYAFRDTPDFEEGAAEDREMSGGPSTKRIRYDPDETPANDYELDDDDEASRSTTLVTKKVPILRISFAGQNKHHYDEEDSASASYGRGKNLGIRGKSGGKRGQDGEEQRITRSKVRQTGRSLGDDADHYAGKKKRHRVAQEQINEEPLDDYPIVRIVERQVTPNPETLTEGQKILYQPPHSGVYNLKKRIEQRWVEDMKKDEENAKKAAGRFDNMLLCSEMRPYALDQIFNVKREMKYPSVPKDLRHEVEVHELFMMQEDEKRKLSERMQVDRMRLQLTYEQEFARMERRKDGTAPQMSATRVFREAEIQNPLMLDHPVPNRPEIDRTAFEAKVAKGQKKLAKMHKMDAEALYSVQRGEWKTLLRQKSLTERDKIIEDLVSLVPIEELNLRFD